MDKVNKENNTSGHMQLDLTYDEVKSTPRVYEKNRRLL